MLLTDTYCNWEVAYCPQICFLLRELVQSVLVNCYSYFLNQASPLEIESCQLWTCQPDPVSLIKSVEQMIDRTFTVFEPSFPQFLSFLSLGMQWVQMLFCGFVFANQLILLEFSLGI